MNRFLFWALAIGYLVGAIVVTLGAAYAWLWIVVLAVKVLGFAVGSVVAGVSLLGLVWMFHLGREPLMGWYQPWDHSYWIAAERLGVHCWQRAINGAARRPHFVGNQTS